MAAKMNGKWKLHSSDKFDEYMKELGVGMALRKMGNLAKPTLTLEVDEGNFYYKSVSTFRNLELRAKIGEEFDEETPDGRKVKTTFSWNGNKLEQLQKWDGKTSSIVRFVDDEDDLINICEMNKVVSRRVYKRAK